MWKRKNQEDKKEIATHSWIERERNKILWILLLKFKKVVSKLTRKIYKNDKKKRKAERKRERKR